MPRRINSIDETIGEFREAIKTLQRTDDDDKNTRREIHRKLELLGNASVQQTNDMREMKREIAEIKPFAADYIKYKNRLAWYSAVGIILMSAVWSVILALLGNLFKWLSIKFGF